MTCRAFRHLAKELFEFTRRRRLNYHSNFTVFPLLQRISWKIGEGGYWDLFLFFTNLQWKLNHEELIHSACSKKQRDFISHFEMNYNYEGDSVRLTAPGVDFKLKHFDFSVTLGYLGDYDFAVEQVRRGLNADSLIMAEFVIESFHNDFARRYINNGLLIQGEEPFLYVLNRVASSFAAAFCVGNVEVMDYLAQMEYIKFTCDDVVMVNSHFSKSALRQSFAKIPSGSLQSQQHLPDRLRYLESKGVKVPGSNYDLQLAIHRYCSANLLDFGFTLPGFSGVVDVRLVFSSFPPSTFVFLYRSK